MGTQRPNRRAGASVRRTAALHQAAVGDPSSLDGATPAGWAAVALALVVHLLTLALAVGALAALLLLSPKWWAAIVSLPLAALAWLVWPRGAGLPEDDAVVWSASPLLVGLVAEVAVAAGTRPPHRIGLTAETNAAYSVVGVRRERVLLVGLPLWVALTPQARVGVLAHELGHATNHDSRHGAVVGSALDSLAEWATLCRYDSSWVGVRVPMQDVDMVSVANLAETIASWLLRLLGLVPMALYRALLSATLRTSQRAEYRADVTAWAVAGHAGAVEAAEALLRAPVLDTAARRAVMARRRDVLAHVVQALGRVDHDTVAVLRAEARASHATFDSHPPADLRVDFARSLPTRDPLVVLGERGSTALDGELAAALQWADKRLWDRYAGR